MSRASQMYGISTLWTMNYNHERTFVAIAKQQETRRKKFRDHRLNHENYGLVFCFSASGLASHSLGP